MSVFTKYDNFKTNGQAFCLYEIAVTLETPLANIMFSSVKWISAVRFSDDSALTSYASRVVSYFLGDTLQDFIAAGSLEPLLDGCQ